MTSPQKKRLRYVTLRYDAVDVDNGLKSSNTSYIIRIQMFVDAAMIAWLSFFRFFRSFSSFSF
jgi:hypothetical protein